jgi:uncharacterized protein involved in exopolysaccharide biosynthesis
MLFGESTNQNEELMFSETLEGDQLIMEAILEDAGVELSEEEAYDLISEQLLSERSIVRLDKKAKRSLAEKKAVIVLAREANDPLYRKLVKVYKAKSTLISKLVQKYGTRAKSRVRKNASNKKVNGIVKRTASGAKSKSLFKGSDMPGRR